MKIVFFDDYPYHIENQIFMKSIIHELSSFSVVILNAITELELKEILNENAADLIILDIMARVNPALKKIDKSEGIPDNLVGLELLKLIRHGHYGVKNATTQIFMRTARGEPQIRSLCLASGANEYFSAGKDDDKLIEKIITIANSISENRS